MDVTELVALRKRLNASLAASGDAPQGQSFLPFICKALVAAFRKYPYAQRQLRRGGAGAGGQRGSFHFGIAAATDEGLTVPVVKDVDRLTVRQLAEEISRLGGGGAEQDAEAGRADRRHLHHHLARDQTGGLFAMPIINYPEVAILGVHRIRKRPVVTTTTRSSSAR